MGPVFGLGDGIVGRQYGREDGEMRLGYSAREEDEYEEVGKYGSISWRRRCGWYGVGNGDGHGNRLRNRLGITIIVKQSLA